ncbi:MtN3 and saliva related transmembrane protein [Chitinivorax tropicus]|uniref:MtN3 and saliva related transmembrane protein n=1 Tax=Chitinivorax tropicus TaxID=714531 RepID=A0A840MRR8_9PROT|nr:SemiSWEET transporter [Chitinivorax tropicus]MBB5019807.1 MtN3 and saliva related transmembrane protein [Chitinivorax tropicus]
MSVLAEWLGMLAAVCTTGAFVPQVLHVWRRKSAQDISFGMYFILVVGIVLWLIYGILIVAWPVILANGATLILALAILVMKVRYDRVPKR